MKYFIIQNSTTGINAINVHRDIGNSVFVKDGETSSILMLKNGLSQTINKDYNLCLSLGIEQTEKNIKDMEDEISFQKKRLHILRDIKNKKEGINDISHTLQDAEFISLEILHNTICKVLFCKTLATNGSTPEVKMGRSIYYYIASVVLRIEDKFTLKLLGDNQKKMNMYISAHKKMVKNNGLYIEELTEIVTELKKTENKKGSF
jgi:hypothetical protein